LYSRAGLLSRAKPLNPKVIKSEDDNENLSKSNYAIYGLVFFCVLLVVLFILRKNKYNKNEFR